MMPHRQGARGIAPTSPSSSSSSASRSPDSPGSSSSVRPGSDFVTHDELRDELGSIYQSRSREATVIILDIRRGISLLAQDQAAANTRMNLGFKKARAQNDDLRRMLLNSRSYRPHHFVHFLCLPDSASAPSTHLPRTVSQFWRLVNPENRKSLAQQSV